MLFNNISDHCLFPTELLSTDAENLQKSNTPVLNDLAQNKREIESLQKSLKEFARCAGRLISTKEEYCEKMQVYIRQIRLQNLLYDKRRQMMWNLSYECTNDKAFFARERKRTVNENDIMLDLRVACNIIGLKKCDYLLQLQLNDKALLIRKAHEWECYTKEFHKFLSIYRCKFTQPNIEPEFYEIFGRVAEELELCRKKLMEEKEKEQLLLQHTNALPPLVNPK